jgi:hypothetical protein
LLRTYWDLWCLPERTFGAVQPSFQHAQRQLPSLSSFFSCTSSAGASNDVPARASAPPLDRHTGSSTSRARGRAAGRLPRARLEGVVAKKRSSRYRSGERGWIKLKNPDYWRRDEEREALARSRERRGANSHSEHGQYGNRSRPTLQKAQLSAVAVNASTSRLHSVQRIPSSTTP